MTWGEVQRQALKKLDLPDQAFREEYRPALVQAANEGALLLATAGRPIHRTALVESQGQPLDLTEQAPDLFRLTGADRLEEGEERPTLDYKWEGEQLWLPPGTYRLRGPRIRTAADAGYAGRPYAFLGAGGPGPRFRSTSHRSCMNTTTCSWRCCGAMSLRWGGNCCSWDSGSGGGRAARRLLWRKGGFDVARLAVPRGPKRYVTTYARFRGVDFSTDPALVDPQPLPLCPQPDLRCGRHAGKAARMAHTGHGAQPHQRPVCLAVWPAGGHRHPRQGRHLPVAARRRTLLDVGRGNRRPFPGLCDEWRAVSRSPAGSTSAFGGRKKGWPGAAR